MSDFGKIPNLTMGTDPSPYKRRIAQLERELAEAEAKHAETIGEIFRNEVVPLKQQLAEARKDTERLDWLESSEWELYNPETDDIWWPDHREAIDNAMKGCER